MKTTTRTMIAIFISMLTTYTTSALVPFFFEVLETELSAGPTKLGLIVMLNRLTNAVAGVWWGWSSDSLRRIPLWVVSSVVGAVPTFVLAASVDYTMFLLVYAACAVGWAGLKAITLSLIPDMFAPSKRGKALGTVGVFVLAATITAVLVSTMFQGQVVGLDGWRVLHALMALAQGPACLAVYMLATDPPRGGKEPDTCRRSRSRSRNDDYVEEVVIDESWSSADPGSTTAEEGSASAEEGSATAEEGSASAEEGSASAKEGSASAEEGSASAEEGSASAEEGSASAEEGSVSEQDEDIESSCMTPVAPAAAAASCSESDAEGAGDGSWMKRGVVGARELWAAVVPLVKNGTLALFTASITVQSLPVAALSFAVLWFRYSGLSELGAAAAYAFAGMGFIVGSGLGGVAGDVYSTRAPNYGRIVIAHVCVVLNITLILVLILALPKDNVLLIGAAMFLIGICLAVPPFACDLACSARIVRSEERGLAFALQGLVSAGLASTGSILVGAIAESWFGYTGRDKDIDEVPQAVRSKNRDALSHACLVVFMTCYVTQFLLYFVIYRAYPRARDRILSIAARDRDLSDASSDRDLFDASSDRDLGMDTV